MNKKQATYTFRQYFSAIFMMLALLWLTISTPFVFSSQQKITQQEKKATNNSPLSSGEEETTNPFANTTEEKTPSGPNTLNEYLHSTEDLQHPSSMAVEHSSSHTADLYTAYHGELVGPPPKA